MSRHAVSRLALLSLLASLALLGACSWPPPHESPPLPFVGGPEAVAWAFGTLEVPSIVGGAALEVRITWDPAPNDHIIDRELMVPAVPALDGIPDLPPLAARDRAVCPADLRLPQVAARVGGLTLDHTSYPLVRFLVADASHWATFTPQPRTIHSRHRVPEVLFLGAVGDLMTGRGIQHELDRGEAGLRRVFGDLLPELRSLDWLVGNLEGAVTTLPRATTKTYTFKFPPRVLSSLQQSGFDYLMLTNNHVWDYGPEGFADTLTAFKTSAMPTSGVGRNLAEALPPWWVLSPGGQALAIQAFGAYPVERNGFDGSRLAAAGPDQAGILWATAPNRRAAMAVTILQDHHAPRPSLDEDLAPRHHGDIRPLRIALVHGGQEYRTDPDPRTRALYRAMIDQGWDLVIGSHPHVLQPFEVHNGGLVFHSLGNFLFPGMEEMPEAEDSLVLRLGLVGGRVFYLEPLAARLQGPTVQPAMDPSILERWYKRSRALATAPLP